MKLWKTEFHLMQVTDVRPVAWDMGWPLSKLHWFGFFPKLKKTIDFYTDSFAGAEVTKEKIVYYNWLVVSVTNRFPLESKYVVVGSAKEYSHLLELGK